MIRIGSDLAFSRDNSAWFLPWMLAVVVYLGSLTIAGIILADGVLERWVGDDYSSVTVQLPSNTEWSTIEDVLGTLNQAPGVAQARPVSKEEINELIEPWLAPGDLMDQLPMPWLIDVLPKKGATVDWVAIETRLSENVPGALVDTGMVWVEELVDPVRSFQVAALFILALIVVSTVAAVSLTARAAFAIHRDTIEVMHLLGAADKYIMRQIQRRVTGMAARGGIVGAAFAVTTIFAIGYVINRIDNPLFPAYQLGMGCWVATFAMLLLVLIIAALSSRRVVERELSDML